MKKSRITIILASALLCMGLYVTPFVASADEAVDSVETSEIVSVEEVVEETESVENTANDEVVEDDGNVIPETDDSKWFEETIQPILLQYGAQILAMITVAFAVFKKLSSVVKMFISALEKLGIANEQVKEANEKMEALEKQNAEWQEHMDAYVKETITKLIEGIKEAVGDKVDDIDDVVHKILEVEEIVYESNPTLVGNGTAKKVSEVIRK